MTTCFVVLEWKDGKTRDPIAVCATRQQAEAMTNAFRDVVEVELEAELAQRWQPLPDGIHPTNKLKDYFEIEGEWLTVTETLYNDGTEKSSTLVELTADTRLCRLVTKGAENE